MLRRKTATLVSAVTLWSATALRGIAAAPSHETDRVFGCSLAATLDGGRQ